jgi:hypothetical protein
MASIYATSASPLLPHWDRGTSPHSCVMQAELVPVLTGHGKRPDSFAAMHVETGGRKGMQDLGAEKDTREGVVCGPRLPDGGSGPFLPSKIKCED